MSNDTIDIFSVWRPSSQPVLEQVFCDRIPIVVLLSHGLSGMTLGQKFKGRISRINGNLIGLRVESQKTIPATGPAKMAQGTVVGEIFFNITIQKADGTREPLGYSGEGNVMDVISDEDGKPKELILRVAHGFTTRRMRRDERLEWRQDIESVIGLESLTRVPETRAELKTILDSCTNNIFNPTILNISAGGICIKLNMAAAKRTSSPLFFLLLTFPEKNKKSIPFFLVAKKVGYHYEPSGQEADGLRFLFVYELNWGASQTSLVWNNIENTGSEHLRSLLLLFMRKDAKPAV